MWIRYHWLTSYCDLRVALLFRLPLVPQPAPNTVKTHPLIVIWYYSATSNISSTYFQPFKRITTHNLDHGGRTGENLWEYTPSNVISYVLYPGNVLMSISHWTETIGPSRAHRRSIRCSPWAGQRCKHHSHWPAEFMPEWESGIHHRTQVRDLYQTRANIEREYAAKLQALSKKATEKKVKMEARLIIGEEPTRSWDATTLRRK